MHRSLAPLSPASLALTMVAVSVLFTLLPAARYVRAIGEPDYMSGNLKMYFYIGTMTALFVLGGAFGLWLTRRVRGLRPRPIKTSPFNVLVAASFLFVPIALLDALYLLSLVATFGAAKVLTFLVAPSIEGRLMVDGAAQNNGLSWLLSVSTAMTSFAGWLALTSFTKASEPSRRRRRYAWRIFELLLVLTLLSALVTQARGPTLVLFLELGFVWVAVIAARGHLKVWALLLAAVGVVAAFLAFWLAVQASRGGAEVGFRGLINILIGYFPASYNRLALALNGQLALPGSGSGFVALQWVYTFPVLSHALGVEEAARGAGLPVPQSEYQAWLDAFQSVRDAGLNQAFIWLTAWGAVHADIGPFAALWWLWYGLVCGWTWQAFVARNAAGLLLYPYLAVTILQWYADPIFGWRTVPILMVLSVLLTGLLWFFDNALPQRERQHDSKSNAAAYRVRRLRLK